MLDFCRNIARNEAGIKTCKAVKKCYAILVEASKKASGAYFEDG